MVSPGQLVKVVASTLGVPEVSVVQHDRNLAAAGLRRKGGRGTSAAKMTPLDAANLLIGVTASSLVKDTVETVNQYADLPSRDGETAVRRDTNSFERNGNEPPKWRLDGLPIPALIDLPAKHTLRDALVALVVSASDGSLENALSCIPVKTVNGTAIPFFWGIEVTFWGPFPQASVCIYAPDFREAHFYSAIPTDMAEIQQWSDRLSKQSPSGDLTQIRRFTSKTIQAVGALLKSVR